MPKKIWRYRTTNIPTTKPRKVAASILSSMTAMSTPPSARLTNPAAYAAAAKNIA